MSGEYTGALRVTEAVLSGTTYSDPDLVLTITDRDTTMSIRDKISGSSALTKVDDSTAPAPGCFQVSGSYYPQGFGPYYKISEGDEFTFEFWVKWESGDSTYNLLYAGSQFYNAAGTYLGNSQRYWGESSLQITTATTDWVHVSGTLGPSRGANTGQIPTTAETMRLLFLFNYAPNGTSVTRYCGLKVYKSNPTVTKLYRKTLGSEAGSTRNRDLVIDSNGDIMANDLFVDGNVGIGTIDPNASLDVAGTSPAIRITNTTDPLGAADVGSLEFFTDDSSTGASRILSSIVCVNSAASPSIPDGQLVFKTSVGGGGAVAATEKMRIDSSGNVGIGTTSPGAKLDVNSNISTSSTDVIKISQATNGAIKAAASLGLSIQNGGEATNAADLWFSTALNGSLNERARITSTGHFQVSTGYFELTSQPSTKLWLSTNQVQLYSGGLLVFAGYNASNDAVVVGNESGDINVTLAGGANNKVLYLEGSSGNVGIGTKTPNAKLDVQGTQGQLFSVTDDLSGDIFSVADISGVPIMNVNSDGTSYFDGNVGIGTDDPSTKLEVDGTITARKNIISTYDGSDTNTGAYGINRTLSGLTANARGYRDDSIVTAPGNTAVSYAGIDIKTQMTQGTFGHVTMFQGRTSLDNADVTDFEGLYMGGLSFANTSNVTNYVGVTVENPTAFSGTITNFVGTKIKAPTRTGGTITNFYGLKVEDNVSATNKWAIYSDDDSVNSKMLGQLESGDITVQNTTTAASLNLNSLSTGNGGNYIHAKKSDGSNQWVLGSNSGFDDRVTLKQYNAADIIFANNSGDAMIIDTNGKVGIGATSPDVKLDVVSGTNNGIRISATDTTSNWRDIGIRSYVTQAEADALTDHTYLFTTNPSGQTDPAFQRYGGTVLQCRDDGNSNFSIRIGNGSGHNTALNINASGVATFNNTVTATNFILSSDERLKNSVEEVDNKHIDVNWKTFEMNSKQGQKRYGVIAQELEEVHPEFVNTDDKGFKSVKYIDLLIAKIAELEARLEKLEK